MRGTLFFLDIQLPLNAFERQCIPGISSCFRDEQAVLCPTTTPDPTGSARSAFVLNGDRVRHSVRRRVAMHDVAVCGSIPDDCR